MRSFNCNSIGNWRRGIADVEESAVEDEFITPKADKLRRGKSNHRKREERMRDVEPSLSAQSSRTDLSGRTVRRKPLPSYLDDESARSERSGRMRRTSKTEKSHKSGRSERCDATIRPDKKERKAAEKREKEEEKERDKKPSALRMMFKGVVV